MHDFCQNECPLQCHGWLHCQQARLCPCIWINTIWVGCLCIISVRKLPPGDPGESDLCPRGAADGTPRWQGVSPVDPPRRYALHPFYRSARNGLPLRPVHWKWAVAALQDAMNSCEDKINKSFGDGCHKDWWFPGIFCCRLVSTINFFPCWITESFSWRVLSIFF